MALIKFGRLDWLAGFRSAIAGSAYIPAVTLVDSSGNPATGSDVNLAEVGGTATAVGHGLAATALRVELPTDGTGVVGLNAGSAVIGKVSIDQTTPGTTNGVQIIATTNVSTLTTSITRPTNTTAYAANQALANSTSAPTTGGFTFAGAARASGGNGTIQSAVISASAGTAYQGEIWIFDQAVTATNDGAALSVSDSDILNIVGVIPFFTNDVNAANSISYITGLNIGYTCVGAANLRFLVKILAAVTPGNAEVLNVRLQVSN